MLQDYDKEKRTGEVFGMPGIEDFSSGTLIDALNVLGKQGWELTGYTSMEFPDGFLFHYILKRPVSE